MCARPLSPFAVFPVIHKKFKYHLQQIAELSSLGSIDQATYRHLHSKSESSIGDFLLLKQHRPMHVQQNLENILRKDLLRKFKSVITTLSPSFKADTYHKLWIYIIVLYYQKMQNMSSGLKRSQMSRYGTLFILTGQWHQGSLASVLDDQAEYSKLLHFLKT